MLQLAMAPASHDDEPTIVGELFEYVPNLGWHNPTTRLWTFAMTRPLQPNDRVERPATMTVPRPDAAHSASRSAAQLAARPWQGMVLLGRSSLHYLKQQFCNFLWSGDHRVVSGR
jgi:hypothetical protein